MFSELAIIVSEMDAGDAHLDARAFEVLHKMHEIKPFQLVFLLEFSAPLRLEAQRDVEGFLDSAIVKDFFDFLDLPPTVKYDGIPPQRW